MTFTYLPRMFRNITLAITAALPILLSTPIPGQTMSAIERSELLQLDTVTRLEQRCDVEAMEKISREQAKFSIDKVLAYAFSEPVITAHTIMAAGAAFRSQNHWHRLSFTCTTDSSHINIRSFEYQIGAEIPKSEWARHYLTL